MGGQKEGATLVTAPLLETRSLTIRFGGLTALNSFDMKLDDKELIGIIGPNGAGKTTAFNMITGHYAPSEGEIVLEGESITSLNPSSITQKGIARTFQNIRLFKDLSVIDNIKIAAHTRTYYNLWSNLLRTRKCREEESRIHRESLELLDIFKLAHTAPHRAKNLPYGDQRKLEIARALATRPKILLLDEPAAGMNPKETGELTELISWVRNHFKIAILLIEHDMRLVMKICERIYVLNHGELIAQGTPAEIRSNPDVVKAYLGGEG